MKECSKSISRRMRDPNFINYYFSGDGLDIGGAPDPLSLYAELFSNMTSIKTWDWPDGDAQYLASVVDASFDFVHSSHCLEHLRDPFEGIKNWIRVLKPGGYLVVSVPDEDLYEQGIWPSNKNLDHKHSFTIYKPTSWCEASINIVDILSYLGSDIEVIRIELLNSSYRYSIPNFDQTLTPIGECGIEFVLRKRSCDESFGINSVRNLTEQPDQAMRIHLNQYSDDLTSLKASNRNFPPFTNDSDI